LVSIARDGSSRLEERLRSEEEEEAAAEGGRDGMQQIGKLKIA
jgi:hypothetical protein